MHMASIRCKKRIVATSVSSSSKRVLCQLLQARRRASVWTVATRLHEKCYSQVDSLQCRNFFKKAGICVYRQYCRQRKVNAVNMIEK
jgi:hypothetical protein